MSQIGYVGFDTSNYTTSAAVCTGAGEVLANIRLPLPVKEGARGLRQSDAVFLHSRNLPQVCGELREAVRGLELRGRTEHPTPRSADGSYMPCFFAGRAAAAAFAAARDLPVEPCSHQDGHIMAALWSCGGADRLLRAPFAAFHVSGGTTEVLHVTPREAGFAVALLGGSADLHAGQAIDRVGVMMGLRFPCGRELEELAARNTREVPRPKISVTGGMCHFSGLENLAARLWEQTGDRPLVAAFALEYCARTLERLTAFVDESYPGIPIVYAGGVMSNRYLQSVLGRRPGSLFAAPEFSADNAAGVALLCRRAVTQREGREA